ncbi:MAG: right-handed parallel beta-helix repeat-containing protein [Acidobacteriaceae bacterium]
MLNRRHLAKSALLGGASALLSTTPLSAQQIPPTNQLLDPRTFGAKGDGHTDDTASLQSAIDAAAEKRAAVFLPPGVYLTRELHLRPAVALTGIPAWNYSQADGGSILRLASADSTCLLNLTDARGATLHGLALDGASIGQNIHGIATIRTAYGPHEDGFCIDTCQIARFTGAGLNLSHVWCFSVRHCEMMANHGDGLTLRGWDAFILDNWLSGNGRAGFAAREENASVTFTANRVEWNREENMLVTGGDGYQITGNFFDRAGTVGIALRKNPQSASWNKGPCTQFSITGNFIKRSGKFADPGNFYKRPGESVPHIGTFESTQILLDGSTGVTCTGNTLQSGQDDGNQGLWSPSYGIVVQNLDSCVISNNVLHDGALRELLIDLGGHGNVVVENNPGRIFEPPSP